MQRLERVSIMNMIQNNSVIVQGDNGGKRGPLKRTQCARIMRAVRLRLRERERRDNAAPPPPRRAFAERGWRPRPVYPYPQKRALPT